VRVGGRQSNQRNGNIIITRVAASTRFGFTPRPIQRQLSTQKHSSAVQYPQRRITILQ
jgi:hypothetical protein